ncbi:hypothetical protein [Cryptosporangium sp. NPDC048952]|uniref:hypothetical protein n=1 Tax=Cryptosporangium sp. NPDC048952 TaxID=3363961 RepID=UPI0037231C65
MTWCRAARHARRMQRLFDALDLPDGITDPYELCRLVGEHLDCRIDLEFAPLPFDRPESPCGVTLLTPGGYLMLVEGGTWPGHRLHIVAHELGHLLCGHVPAPRDDIPGLRGIPVLTRLSYRDPRERDAEAMAGLIGRRAMLPPRPTGRAGRIYNSLRPRRSGVRR